MRTKKLKILHVGGSARADFTDSYGQKCLIGDSILVHVNPILWLGVTKDRLGSLVVPMWLNQQQAAALIPILQRFVDTGSISESEATDA